MSYQIEAKTSAVQQPEVERDLQITIRGCHQLKLDTAVQWDLGDMDEGWRHVVRARRLTVPCVHA